MTQMGRIYTDFETKVKVAISIISVAEVRRVLLMSAVTKQRDMHNFIGC